ncbi:lipopolysaccharide biosynthesis protein [Occultella gossypii]|uniref:Polysaccharide biosynthesis C-terminal domain-containing protein n=1 Tax=Occultella gossypii TaxID=2800820 RepID=A0ABS7SG61_9MICO|nr:polysaccharide biosynthesis C-terminal domain-containing protein [Occultella gossypii]MBZ2199130.1 polysaccharide biosynthesis C-terminal domain-containing protein [Occultella gossypii]
MSTGHAIGLVTISRFGTLGVSLVGGVLLARSLEVPARGVLSVSITLVSLLASVGAAGLETAALRSAGGSDGSAVLYSSIRRSALVTCACVPVSLVLLMFKVPIAGLQPLEAAIAVLTIPVIVLSQLLSNCSLGMRRYRVWVASTVGTVSAYVIGIAGLTIAGVTSLGAYLAAFALGYVFSAMVLLTSLRGAARRPSRDAASRVAASASRMTAITLLQMVFLRVHAPLVQALGSSGAAGLLAVATPLVDALLFLPVAAGLVLLPRYAAQNRGSARPLQDALRVSLITALGAIALGLLAPIVVPFLYGADYADASTLVQWMLPGAVAFAFARVLQSHLLATESYATLVLGSLLAVIFSVAVQLILSPHLGATGAAIAIAAGYVTMTVTFSIGYARRPANA